MPLKTKITNGKYTTFQDQQSYGETHDMLVKALPGQSYVLVKLNKVSTTQVTGEAMKKQSVGGKGGMGSQGDVREQEKQIDVSSRVMVMSGPTQEIFNYNQSLKKVVKDWDENGKPIYVSYGKKHTYKRFVPSHLFGDKEIKGWTEFTTTHGRDYDEFTHSSSLDASDSMRQMEIAYRDSQVWDEYSAFLGVKYKGEGYHVAQLHGNKSRRAFIQAGAKMALESLIEARKRYDEICGYKDAYKYVGIDGAEHRRYRFEIHNTLNFDTKVIDTSHKPKTGYRVWENSSYNHHIMGPNWHLWFDNLSAEKKELVRKDHIQYILWQLDQLKKDDDWGEVYDVEVKHEKSEEFLRLEAIANDFEKERRRSAFKGTEDIYADTKVVYRWEGNKRTKLMFNIAPKAVRDDSWTCTDRADKYEKKNYYKSLRK